MTSKPRPALPPTHFFVLFTIGYGALTERAEVCRDRPYTVNDLMTNGYIEKPEPSSAPLRPTAKGQVLLDAALALPEPVATPVPVWNMPIYEASTHSPTHCDCAACEEHKLKLQARLDACGSGFGGAARRAAVLSEKSE